MPRILLLMVFVAIMSPAHGDAPQNIGKNELSLNGDFDFQAPNGDTIRLQIGYSWYLSNDLLMGGEYLWALSEDIAPGDYRSQQANFITEKLFLNDGRWLPYVGAEAGFRNSKFGSDSESGLVFGARVGLRYLFNEAVFIDTSLRLQLSDKDVFFVDFEAEDQYLYPSVGLRAVF